MSRPFDHEVLGRYAERYFRRKAGWPTVRVAARSLAWKQERVIDAVEGDPDSALMLTSHNSSPPVQARDHYVELVR